MVTSGAGRTLSHAGSNVALMYLATSVDENNTVLARRALVQQNCLSSWPIMWKSSTGLPDFCAAVWASANEECQFTNPGFTAGFSSAAVGTASGAGATGPAEAEALR